MLNKIKQNYLFAVIRGNNEADAFSISEAAISGGIRNIEVAYTTPNASTVISKLSKSYQDKTQVIIGAGTVMTTDIAKEAIKAGAKFLVSPHFSKDIQEVALASEVYYFPGCMTATEIVTALESGVKLVKIFPGGTVGTEFIKNIHGPFPDVDMMPSGGVSLENVLEWKKAGACAVGIGSTLSSDVKTKGYESVTEKARSFVYKIKEA
ncbi:bifunctional 2-keto-4-hydroxyglutarate aldolase/2-keto-3-deoxy-6-phosphogluconate aldolase [Listeria monocytogenes]|uniref:bifunctional 2-keto-4-hydroxyglutarate aldolase/2-keto-3-deoxy-6-phosphogluconate aldolase n=1 Tax=Listeria monocytogenes TaxID=1639 RepID=UPI00087365DE|nr:bifunctional 2-keto-4-hydroxyglutarate aldolase/2-keto-3-deoxy-6-phosphogluconate aldolase [Listeria monocytogenes]EAC3357072.1 bifunctional 4-hydroxy-2-oxoglutarate aldolase/2-dehydro-3-deoxy-phosphogluconate aldolase [Listeria monocytogenes]EAC7182536.1 bifunctional 4-hydroxy-2-oxoglutarate aldolase/2-dehydro-3-deoxy-phosphogluconate aldolase [Listeria monocytogenes]EAC8000824.1 bifunctional 4-hydroxy-2-oxoglutarate aldolase/2-dehydro-3-deoxy-phosphogluconate aldolase [Listeria monocytogene